MRRGKLPKIGQTEAALYVTYLAYCVIEPIVAKGLLLDFLEFIAELVVLFDGKALFPRWKYNSILPGCMIAVHQYERFQCPRQSFRSCRTQAPPWGGGQDVTGNFASTQMLGNEDIRKARRRPSGLPDRWKDISLFQFAFMVILAKGAEEPGCSC